MPWDQGIASVLARATPLAQIKTATPAQRAQVHALQQRFAGHALLALPLQSGNRDDTVVIDSASRRPVAVLPINLAGVEITPVAQCADCDPPHTATLAVHA